MEEVDHLRKKLYKLNVANPTLRSLEGLPGMSYAFFPGGNGLYKGIQATRFPVTGTLILGSNYGCLSGFVDEEGELLCTDERCCPTWNGLRQILHASGIDRDECFFTNAWPFLHHGKANLSGLIEHWLRDEALMAKCIQFFKVTLITMQPRLIVALGLGPASFLGHVWPQQLGLWKGRTWGDVDGPGINYFECGSIKAVCVAITHPSMRNSKYRPKYGTREKEVELLKEAAQRSGIVKM